MQTAEGELPDEDERHSTCIPASSAAARRVARSIVVPRPSCPPRLEDREGHRCPVCEGGPLRIRTDDHADASPTLQCPDCHSTYQHRRPALAPPRAPTPDPQGHEDARTANTWKPPTRAKAKRAAGTR